MGFGRSWSKMLYKTQTASKIVKKELERLHVEDEWRFFHYYKKSEGENEGKIGEKGIERRKFQRSSVPNETENTAKD